MDRRALELLGACLIGWIVGRLLNQLAEPAGAGPWAAVGRNTEELLELEERASRLEGDVPKLLDAVGELRRDLELLEDRAMTHRGWIASVAERAGGRTDEDLEEELEELESKRPTPDAPEDEPVTY